MTVTTRPTRRGRYAAIIAPLLLAMSLGAGETTVLRMTSAYSMLANGGKRIKPTLIDRIQDRDGVTLRRQDQRACDGCTAAWSGQAAPVIADVREQVLDPITAYQVVSMAQGVVDRERTGHPVTPP